MRLLFATVFSLLVSLTFLKCKNLYFYTENNDFFSTKLLRIAESNANFTNKIEKKNRGANEDITINPEIYKESMCVIVGGFYSSVFASNGHIIKRKYTFYKNPKSKIYLMEKPEISPDDKVLCDGNSFCSFGILKTKTYFIRYEDYDSSILCYREDYSQLIALICICLVFIVLAFVVCIFLSIIAVIIYKRKKRNNKHSVRLGELNDFENV